MSKKLLITNCRLFNNLESPKDNTIFIENGIIKQIGEAEASTAQLL